MESKILSVFIFAIVLAMAGGASAQTEGQVNVASQFLDSCSASTTYNNGGAWDCTTLFNGIIEDGWAAADNEDTAWVEFSLTQSFYVEALKVYNKESNWRVSSYTFDYWDENSGSWKRILHPTKIGFGETVLSELPMTPASRFRLNMDCYNSGSSSCQLKEVEIYATQNNEGPVSHWNFDEGSGDVLGDSAGDNDGTIVGATWTTGVCGNALSFDGDNDYVIDTSPSMIPTGSSDRTLGAWVKASTTIHMYAAGFGDGVDNQAFALTTDNDGTAFFVGHHNDLDTNIDIADTQWHFFVATYDGTTVRTYVDGIFTIESDKNLNTADNHIVIGAREDIRSQGLTFNKWEGIIDEVSIYNRALSAEEINALYQSPCGAPAPEGDANKGHGNDADGVDEDNPGKGCQMKNANGNQKRC